MNDDNPIGIRGYWRMAIKLDDSWVVLQNDRGTDATLAHGCTESFPLATRRQGECYECGARAPEAGLTMVDLLR